MENTNIIIYEGAKFEYADSSGLIGLTLLVETIALGGVYFKTGLTLGQTMNAKLHSLTQRDLYKKLQEAKANQVT